MPHTWQTDGLDHPIFRNIATEIQPDDPPRVPKDINPTGADRYAQPETAQLAWVQQPLRFSYANGTLSIGNERQWIGTDDLRLRWRVTEGSRVIAGGEQPLRVAAASTGTVPIPVPVNSRDRERFLTVEAVTMANQPLLPRGHVLAHDQFFLDGTRVPGLEPAPSAGSVTTAETDTSVVASVGMAKYTVDKRSGTLSSITLRGKELLAGGPKLDAWRAPISNETFAWGRAEGEDWRKVGLDRLATTVTGVTVSPVPSGVQVVVTSRVAAPDVANAWFDQAMTYMIDGSGTVQLGHEVTPQGDVRTLTYLPRIGVRLAVSSSYDDDTAAEQGWPEWLNVPSKVAQVAAVRAVAASRRNQDLADGTLVAAVCPGLVDTRASRPWFADFSQAQTPAQAARPVIDLALTSLDPATYGELIQFGKVLPWHAGNPQRYRSLIS